MTKDKIYYNTVSEEETPWEYRFKTQEEFEEEYPNNQHWRNSVQRTWIRDMDYLFGKDLATIRINKNNDTAIRFDNWNISMEMITPNNDKPMPHYMKSPEERKKRFLYESGDFVNVDGYNLNHNDNQAYPFATIDFKTDVGESGTKHSEMFMYGEPLDDFRNDYYVDPVEYKEKFGKEPSNPITYKEIEDFYEGEADFYEYFDDMYQDDIYEEVMEYDYIGRMWITSKVITFWKYPKDKEDLKKVIESIEKESKIKIWDNGWQILIIMVKNIDGKDAIKHLVYSREDGVESVSGDEYDHTEKLIPLEDFESSLNPTEEEIISHIQSPLNKKRIPVFSGVGSKKKMPHALPNELPVETRSRLYQESSKYEIIKQNIKKLDINTLIMKKDEWNEKDKEKLIDLLKIMGVEINGVLEGWYVSNDQKSAIIIITGAFVDGSLDGLKCYSSSSNYINNGSFHMDYPTSKFPDPMTLSEMIKYIENKIIIPKPFYMLSKEERNKRFIRESNESYPYRFKTMEEMEEMGEENYNNWEDCFGDVGWNPDMEILLGTPYPYKKDEIKTDRDSPREERLTDENGQTWLIHWDMLIPNELHKPVPMYMKSKEERNKRFIRENNQYTKYRFKTEEEFVEEYGDNWSNNIENHRHGGDNYSWISSMNYLFGTDFNYDTDIPKKYEHVTIPKRHDSRDVWYITYPMLTKKNVLPNYMKSKEERDKRFIRENNDIKKLGDF